MSFKTSVLMSAAVMLHSQSALAETYLMDCYTIYKLDTGFFSSSIYQNSGASGWVSWCEGGTLEFEGQAVTCKVDKKVTYDISGADFLIDSGCPVSLLSYKERLKGGGHKLNLSVNGEPAIAPQESDPSETCKGIFRASEHLPWSETFTRVTRLDFELGRHFEQLQNQHLVDSVGKELSPYRSQVKTSSFECTKISD